MSDSSIRRGADYIADRSFVRRTLTRNIRERRGEKVSINLPIFKDKATRQVLDPPENSTALFPAALAETPNYRGDMIHLDAMGLGMGCCCLQITFQTRELADARRLYDQLAILCPIMVRLNGNFLLGPTLW